MDASSAVYPTVRESDGELHLAYFLPRCESSAIVRFLGVRKWNYGGPNDEGLGLHPLYGQGLRHYEFHAVPTDPPSELTRWIGTFHEGTLEVEALEVAVVTAKLDGYGPAKALAHFSVPGNSNSLDEEGASPSEQIVCRVRSLVRSPAPTKRTNWTLPAVLTIWLLGGLVILELGSRDMRALRPPGSVETFDSFLSWRPEVSSFWRFSNSDGTFVIASGMLENASPFYLPSGPAEYVFDEEGTMVDWTTDNGDAPEFLEQWGRPALDREAISLSRAKAELSAAPK